MKKKKIPVALRQQVWLEKMGKIFEGKCKTTWCSNIITNFNFECGHNIPESKGGTLELTNLRPICTRCNKSMGSQYTIDEWNRIGKPNVVTVGCCSSYSWCC